MKQNLQSVDVQTRGEALSVLGDRAILWHRARTLLVSDVHIGKTQTFRTHGAPLPDDVDATLVRLQRLVEATDATRLLVVGDLIHHASGLDGLTVEKVKTFVAALPARVALVAGNHDRGLTTRIASWGIDLHEDGYVDGPFQFLHEPIDEPREHFVWSGHLHPTFTLGSGRERLRLPCAFIDEDRGILPAFTHFSNGIAMRRTPRSKIFVFIEDAGVTEV